MGVGIQIKIGIGLVCVCCLFVRIAEGILFPEINIAMHMVGDESDGPDLDFHTIYKRSINSSSDAHEHPQISQITIPAGYSIHDPPPTVFGPTNVEFAVLVFSVRDIKEINEELSLELRLQLAWKDARLKPWVEYIEEGKDYMVLNTKIMDKLWYPDIFIDYVKSIAQPVLLSKPASLRLYKNTGLRYSARVTITMSCPMAFHFYPADTQTCHIDLKSYSYNAEVLSLEWKKKKPLLLLKQDKELPNFGLELASPSVTVVQTSAGFYSGIRLTVLLRRSMKFHLIQTYLPSTLFVIVSWLSFLVPPEMVPGRMAICMTTLLTLTAMFSAVRQNIPKVSYIKALDIWMVTCAFFVFLSLVEYTIVLKLRARRAEAEKKRAARDAALAATILGTDGNQDKARAFPNVGPVLVQSQNQPKLPNKSATLPQINHDELIEKFTWTIVVALFFIFNLIYWPWLLISSGYYSAIGDTKYYGED